MNDCLSQLYCLLGNFGKYYQYKLFLFILRGFFQFKTIKCGLILITMLIYYKRQVLFRVAGVYLLRRCRNIQQNRFIGNYLLLQTLTANNFFQKHFQMKISLVKSQQIHVCNLIERFILTSATPLFLHLFLNRVFRQSVEVKYFFYLKSLSNFLLIFRRK